jgi:hypothetical protein
MRLLRAVRALAVTTENFAAWALANFSMRSG